MAALVCPLVILPVLFFGRSSRPFRSSFQSVDGTVAAVVSDGVYVAEAAYAPSFCGSSGIIFGAFSLSLFVFSPFPNRAAVSP